MVARLLAVMGVYVVLGPLFSGLIYVATGVSLDLVAGHGLRALRDLPMILPFFWILGTQPAIAMAIAMLALWSVLRRPRWRLLAAIPIGIACMLVVVPLLMQRDPVPLVTSLWGWLILLAAGIGMLLSQLIVEAILSRVAEPA